MDQKSIIITGASGALGRAAVEKAIASGYHVHAFDRQESGKTQEHVTEYKVDLLNLSEVMDAVSRVGRIDAVFNIAGGFAMGDESYSENDEQWDKMFALNVGTLRNMNKAVVPVMLGQGAGAIVNVGAFSAQKGVGGMSAYIASKSAVMRLTESLSAEVKEKGINVNAVLPTIIDTPQNRADMPDANFDGWVSPDELAATMLFLSSREAKAIHGALLPVTGLV